MGLGLGLPRHYVCGGQTSPHKPQLVVSHSTCPPRSSSPHAHSFVSVTAVINNNNRNTHNLDSASVTGKYSLGIRAPGQRWILDAGLRWGGPGRPPFWRTPKEFHKGIGSVTNPERGCGELTGTRDDQRQLVVSYLGAMEVGCVGCQVRYRGTCQQCQLRW